MLASKIVLQKLLNDLWNADENRCIPEIDYSINLQGRLRGTRSGKDLANNALFSKFNEERIFSKTTYKFYKKLLDNYEMEIGVAEKVTRDELEENNNFLDAILQTKVMKILHKFLIENKLAEPQTQLFKNQLNKIWFEMYNRSHVRDSCGFEHIFVGELRPDSLTGLHNWIQIYLQEKAGNIDYKGFFEVGTSNESTSPRVITIQFTWKDGRTKSLGSSFVGTSPEFEVAFHTALHLCNIENEKNVQIDKYYMDLVHCRKGDKINTSYIVGLD